MIRYKVIYSPEALIDIRSIYSYISKTLHAPISARKQVNRIRKDIRDLNYFPTRNAFVVWEPWSSMKMHKLPVDNYEVFYVVDEGNLCVKVVRIFYGGRNIEEIVQSY